MAKEQVAKVPSGRVRRTPLNSKGRLTIRDQDPNYKYRFANITDAAGNPISRVEDLLERGYEVVPSTKVGDTRADIPSSLGSATDVSVGGGARAVLLRIPNEYYEEDQAFKQAQIDELEATMKSDAIKGV
jgi:hypothetical protein